VPYAPNNFERYGDTILTSIHFASKIIMYTCPLILPFYMRRDWLSLDTGIFVAKFTVVIALVSLAALVTRCIGRVTNPFYPHFAETLISAHSNFNQTTKSAIEKYDFQFKSWPVDFDVREVETIRKSIPVVTSPGTSLFSITDILAKLLTNSFGISLVYPGSMSLMSLVLEAPLLEGRCKLILEHAAQRNKVRTRDDNTIDTMFVNRTEDKTSANGQTLVLCCEGNAGFYEIGVMSTPLAAGYSVLGWNHPGFGGSSGSPFPEQEKHAVDAVMQFAIHRLGFQPQDIIVMGWSIGGFTSTWLAMNYPDIKGLILDATFDTLEPLALPRMPAILAPIVRQAVNHHINLDVGGQLSQYHGPVTIVRRLKDEMITTKMLELETNRGNNLLIKLMDDRYPHLVNPATRSLLGEMLSQPLWTLDVDMELMEGNYMSYLEHTHQDGAARFPLDLGQDMNDQERNNMLFFLVKKYMSDMDSSHCTPLTTSLMLPPWNPLRCTLQVIDDTATASSQEGTGTDDELETGSSDKLSSL
jgi:pimeloyl-ACP methyl ester carboxylesterase